MRKAPDLLQLPDTYLVVAGSYFQVHPVAFYKAWALSAIEQCFDSDPLVPLAILDEDITPMMLGKAIEKCLVGLNIHGVDKDAAALLLILARLMHLPEDTQGCWTKIGDLAAIEVRDLSGVPNMLIKQLEELDAQLKCANEPGSLFESIEQAIHLFRESASRFLDDSLVEFVLQDNGRYELNIGVPFSILDHMKHVLRMKSNET